MDHHLHDEDEDEHHPDLPTDVREDEPDFYALLNVPRTATPQEIRDSYRHLAVLLHPDKHPPAHRQTASEQFQLLTRAYQVLSDETQRRVYDTLGVAGLDSAWQREAEREGVVAVRDPAVLRARFERYQWEQRQMRAQAENRSSTAVSVGLDMRGFFVPLMGYEEEEYRQLLGELAQEEAGKGGASQAVDEAEEEHVHSSSEDEEEENDEEEKEEAEDEEGWEQDEERREPIAGSISMNRLNVAYSTSLPVTPRLRMNLAANAGTRNGRGTASIAGNVEYLFPWREVSLKAGTNLLRPRPWFALAAPLYLPQLPSLPRLPHLSFLRPAPPSSSSTSAKPALTPPNPVLVTLASSTPTLFLPPPLTLALQKNISPTWTGSLQLDTGTWSLPFWPAGEVPEVWVELRETGETGDSQAAGEQQGVGGWGGWMMRLVSQGAGRAQPAPQPAQEAQDSDTAQSQTQYPPPKTGREAQAQDLPDPSAATTAAAPEPAARFLLPRTMVLAAALRLPLQPAGVSLQFSHLPLPNLHHAKPDAQERKRLRRGWFGLARWAGWSGLAGRGRSTYGLVLQDNLDCSVRAEWGGWVDGRKVARGLLRLKEKEEGEEVDRPLRPGAAGEEGRTQREEHEQEEDEKAREQAEDAQAEAQDDPLNDNDNINEDDENPNPEIDSSTPPGMERGPYHLADKVAYRFSLFVGLMSGLSATATISGRVGKAGWGASVVWGGTGVWLRLRLVTLGQRLIIPIWLVDEPDPDFALGTLGVVATSVVGVNVGRELWMLRGRQRRLKALQDARAEQVVQRRKEAEEVRVMLQDLVGRSVAAEQGSNGLVVLQANYGPRSSIYSGDLSSAVDVTVPVQALVSDGRLHIAGGRPKSGLLGFYDAFPGHKKFLRIRYRHGVREGTVIVGDHEEVSVPSEAHAVPL